MRALLLAPLAVVALEDFLIAHQAGRHYPGLNYHFKVSVSLGSVRIALYVSEDR
jgi:hypothetical protein